MENNNLKRGIFLILWANVINLSISLITNFVLPKYLSVESYAYIKTFQLYINYIGILHLGFADSLYLKYGGKTQNTIDKDGLALELSTIRTFQFIITILALICSVILKDKILMLVSITILPYNMTNCFKGVCQATGNFKIYSTTIKANTIMLFLVNFILLIIGSDRYFVYIVGYCCVYILIWISLERVFKKGFLEKTPFSFLFSLSVLSLNIKNGIFLMLGNFCSLIMTGMDRWFVKILMDTVAFAQYSFSVSMVNFLNYAVTPVSTTLYNYFCHDHSNAEIVRVRKIIMMFASFLIICAYPAKFILEIYLPKYLDATNSLFILFGSHLFFILIQSIYTNLYKAQKRQKTYFIKLCVVLAVGAILNMLCFKLYPYKETFAIATLLCSVFWLVICQFDFKGITISLSEISFLIIVISTFLISGQLLDAIWGFLVYSIVYVICALLFLRKEFVELCRLAKKYSKNLLKR